MWQMILRYRIAISLLAIVLIWPAPSQGFEFQGFGAVTTQVRDNNTNADPNHGAFEVGQLDFFVSQPLGDRLDLLSEVVVTGQTSGAFAVTVERFQIGYVFSDLLTIRAGRFHTTLGYWNHTFHHGVHLQTTIKRPDVGFIGFPVHLTGLWASGYKRLGPMIAQYDAMVGNGQKIVGTGLVTNTVTDNDASKGVNYRLEISPSILPHGGIGASGYFDRVEIFNGATPPALTGEVKQMILGVDLFYTHSPVEVIGEYYYVRNRQRLGASPNTYRNSLFFIQAGYTFFESLTPYARYEQTAVRENGDPYFSPLGLGDKRQILGGLRYDITYQSALKFEGRHIDPKNSDDFQEYAVQWTVAF